MVCDHTVHSSLLLVLVFCDPLPRPATHSYHTLGAAFLQNDLLFPDSRFPRPEENEFVLGTLVLGCVPEVRFLIPQLGNRAILSVIHESFAG